MALFMANTSNVRHMKNGRPQSVLLTEDMPNCSIVTLGATMEDVAQELDHCHAVTAEASEEFVGKFVIVAPEINVAQYRKIDGQIGKFVLEADEVYSAYELEKLDRLEYSEAYFVDGASLVKGDKVKIQAKDANGAIFVKDNAVGGARVVSIVDLYKPIMLQPNVAHMQGAKNPAKLMPESVKMVKIEIEK